MCFRGAAGAGASNPLCFRGGPARAVDDGRLPEAYKRLPGGIPKAFASNPLCFRGDGATQQIFASNPLCFTGSCGQRFKSTVF